MNNEKNSGDKNYTKNDWQKLWTILEKLIVYGAILCISLPIFIIVHRNLPNVNWKFNLDRIIIFALIVFILWFFVKFVRKIFFVFCLCIIGLLSVGSLTNKYGFASLALDYQAMIHSMKDSNKPQKILINKVAFNSSDALILKAMDFTNPEVRTFALEAINKHFKEYQSDSRYRTTIQCLAIFKEINSRWTYVNDPVGQEYYAKASESIKTLSGDCDDHSILMASCIRAVGGLPRLVYTVGHIYPELYIGDESDLESINFLIKHKLFDKESKGRSLYYHIDQDGKIWLNLDYTAHYPGGPFYNNKVLGVIDVEN
ncbi:transglutaminase domain-containing protein [Apibacter raozihei]|uniref:transglutaminase domain-containing protein n=1 Tax=Apibacter raozihei TaxID=2500547 RepID=UPI000FE333E2|nr:transglutaminase domain-containing protein [Apibacter raozihei]